MTSILHNIAAFKNDPAVWCQAVHALIAYAVMLTCYRWGERKRFWIGVILIVVIALVIEAWFDVVYEHDPFFWGGARDLIFYVTGAVLGWLMARFG